MEQTILIVDDDPLVLAMLESAVGKAGYEVCTAINGMEAAEQLRKEEVVLVITDIVMPDREGLETIRYIKRDFPHVKVIAISGGGLNPAEVYLHVAKALGADCTFAKPFERSDLLASVKELLG